MPHTLPHPMPHILPHPTGGDPTKIISNADTPSLNATSLHFEVESNLYTVMILSFRTDMPGQTVQTQI